MTALFFMALVLGGTLAGALGGLLGIGGGILLMPILRLCAGLSPAQAAGTCIVAVFFTTLGGSFRHWRQGHIDIRSIFPVMVAGAAATVIFSLLFSHLAERPRWLDLGTGLVFSLVSARMMTEGLLELSRGPVGETSQQQPRDCLSGKIAVGGLSGILPGLLGIGTGALLVPWFAMSVRVPMQVAVGSSLACFSVNASLSAVFKVLQGFTAVAVALPLCLGTLVGSQFGAALNRHFPSPALKVLFGALFTCVALRFILLFWMGS
ncbi:sulfite exporter TauE/SafE family protein [Candidatus Sumerlaeota bacterium]|nr:sulfite exporter TauE/SafE family protein [Candidatus Sumerlaeota bacterium]